MKHFYEFKKQACLIGLVFLLSGCGSLHKKKTTQKKVEEDYHFQEARLSDIPVLMGAKRLENKGRVVLQDHQQAMFFKSMLPLRDVLNFYEQEMERMGWEQLSLFEGKETILLFEKPYSIVLVLLHEDVKRKLTRITVLLSSKF
jgi:hypothetical protein